MCARRWSPGCGVNRRCRVAKSLSVHASPSDAYALALFLQERDTSGAREVSRRGRLGDLLLRTLSLVAFCSEDVRVVSELQESEGSLPISWCEEVSEGSKLVVGRDCFRVSGARLRFSGFRGKCLQAAVVASLRGKVRERVLRRFKKTCANNDGSGIAGTLREARNVEEVEKVLVEEGLFLWVYEGDNAHSFDEGVVSGPWRLGDERGIAVGGLAWLRDDAHVARLFAVDGHNSNLDRRVTVTAVPPWFRYVVGAPKKNKSRRGANLRKGGEDYGKRHGVVQAVAVRASASEGDEHFIEEGRCRSCGAFASLGC